MPSEEKWKFKLLRKIHYYFAITCIVVHLLATVAFIATNLNDISLLVDVASNVVFIFISIVKLVSISANKTVFVELLQSLDELFPRTSRDQEVFQVQKYFHSFNRMRKVISSVYFTPLSAVVFAPAILYIVKGAWFITLPNLTWYPFDEFDPRFYNFVLVWQWWCILILIIGFLSPDLTLYALITLISMQFNYLFNRLTDLKNIDLKDSDQKIIELFKLHETLIRLSENLNKIFFISIFFNFFGSSIMICFQGYQVITSGSLNNAMQNGVFVMTSLLQILLLCDCGNKLKTASEKVAQAAYDSGWYGKEYKKGKCVILMIQRAQKPCVMTSFKFSVVSLEVYSSVSFIEIF